MKLAINMENVKRDMRSPKFWLSWVTVALGVIVLAAGFVIFTNPYKIIPGGVYGLGRVLHHLVPSIPTGTFGFMVDIPLMIAAFFVFGGGFGAKTIFAALLTPVCMNTMTRLLGEDPTDGISLLSRYLDLSDNLLTASIFGGFLIGAGVGIIIKSGATSGGTDIIGMMFVKFAKMKFSTALLLIESTIVITGMLVLKDWKLPLYSLVAIFVQTKAIDLILEGASLDKLLFIITKKTDEMKEFIIKDLDRSGTLIKSRGLYTGTDREMIFLVVSQKQISVVRDKIKELDPESFVVIVNAHETLGDGFKPLKEEK